jgi:hypothetical protein
LNTYAQNSKESLKWRIKNDETICVAEIHIGNLSAAASKSNKKQAKLFAAKNLLKIIESNTFLREKFFYYLREPRDSGNPNKKLILGLDSGAAASNLSQEGEEEHEELLEKSPEIIPKIENFTFIKRESQDCSDPFEV